LWWAVPPIVTGYILSETWPALAPGLLAAAALPLAAAALILAWRAPATGFRRRATFAAWGVCFLLAATFLAWSWHALRVPPPPAAWSNLPEREAKLAILVQRTFSPRPDEPSASGLGTVVSTPDVMRDLLDSTLYYRVSTRKENAPARGATVEINGILTYLPSVTTASTSPSTTVSPSTPTSLPNPAESFQAYLRSEGINLTLERGLVTRQIAPPSWWNQWTTAQNAHLEKILRHGPANLENLYGNVYVGLFLGKSGALDDPQRTAFTLIGVMYLFAISGLHVAIVAGALLLCLRHLPRLPRSAAELASLALVWLYVEITGGSPSARRAALMFTFYLIALWIGRPRGSLGAILAAGLVTLILNPLDLHSPGFQLSYSVVFGLILYAPPLLDAAQSRLTLWRHLPVRSRAPWQKCVLWTWKRILAAVVLSWTALLCSAPLSAEYFQIVSAGGLLTTLALIPLLSFAMGAAVAAIALGLLAFPPFTWLSWAVNALGLAASGLMQKIVETAAPIPGLHAQITLQPPWIGQAAALSVLAIMLAARPRAHPPRWWYFLLPVLVLAIFAVFTARPA
jgi:competence protein ComEC